MKDLFVYLRNEAKKKQKNGERSFAEDLFRESQWYFSLPWVKKGLINTVTNTSASAVTVRKMELKASPDTVPAFSPSPAPIPQSPRSRANTDWKEYLSRLKNCRKCPGECIEGRTSVVADYYESPSPPILVLFVGDFPRSEEAMEGKSFAGGRETLLRKIVQAMKLQESEYAFALLAKCPPPGEDKGPLMASICQENLYEEILYLRPKVVISLGALATRFLLKKEERLSVIHGQFFSQDFSREGHAPFTTIIVPMFHPDYLLINPNMKKTTWMDLQKVMKHLGLS